MPPFRLPLGSSHPILRRSVEPQLFSSKQLSSFRGSAIRRVFRKSRAASDLTSIRPLRRAGSRRSPEIGVLPRLHLARESMAEAAPEHTERLGRVSKEPSATQTPPGPHSTRDPGSSRGLAAGRPTPRRPARSASDPPRSTAPGLR